MIKGRKGGSSSPVRTPDNLRSTDTVEVLLGICQGPIKGLVDDSNTNFYFGETQFQDVSGTNNFDDASLTIYKGEDAAAPISLHLGGTAGNQSVNTKLSHNLPVTRQTQNLSYITHVDLRFAVQQLYKQDDNGVYESSLDLMIEYRREDDSVWRPALNSMTVAEFGDVASGWTRALNAGTFSGLMGALLGNSKFSPPNTTQMAVTVAYKPGTMDRMSGSSARWSLAVEYRLKGTDDWSTLGNDEGEIGYNPTRFGTIERTKTFTGSVPSGEYEVRAVAYPVDYTDGYGVPRNWKPKGSVKITSAKATYSQSKFTIKGKTSSSAFVREIRFAVPRTDKQYVFRVTRLSQNSDGKYIAEVLWDSIQTVDNEPRAYTNVALAHIVAQATDQFSSIPQLSGVYDLKLVRIPSNYDPYTRTYTGLWDGTFKLDWTNCGPWIVYDLVMDSEYGLNRYFPVTLDKWDCYEAAQWCDTMVPDGKGGYEPRFTFNGLISDAASGPEIIKYVAGTFAGRFYDDLDGTLHLRVDKDAPARHLFTPENVLNGDFAYTFTDITERPNDITVSFINPDLDWQEDRRRVYNQDLIDTKGRVPLDFQAVGCTSEQEALRRAAHKMLTANTETMAVAFQTNRQGLYLNPYDIVLIADPDMDWGFTGRIKTISADRLSFTLRDPIYLEAGITYTLQFQLTDDVIERTVVAGVTGSVYELELDTALPSDVPDRAVFTVAAEGKYGTPKAFRIENITEVEGNPDLIELTCLETNRDKWPLIDGTEPVAWSIEDVSIVQSQSASPPSNFSFGVSTASTPTGARTDLTIMWEHVTEALITEYGIAYRYNQGPWITGNSTVDNEFTLVDVRPGEYTFQVYSVTLSGTTSTAVELTYTIDETSIPIPAVSGLELTGQGNDTVFTNRDAKFSWRLSSSLAIGSLPHPFFRDYEVRIYDTATGSLIRTEHVTDPTYTYEHEKNIEDGTRRTFRLSVAMRDTYGNLGDFTDLIVSNPAPSLPTGVSIVGGLGTVGFQCNEPSELDWAGTKIWLSTETGFTPDETTLVFDGRQSQILLTVDEGTTYYIRFALYDLFGDSDIVVSSEHTVTTTEIINPPEYAFTGIEFAISGNTTTWTAGNAAVSLNGVVDTQAISAGSADWTAGTIYIYYVAGETILRTTTDILIAMQISQIVLATYRGGNELVVGNGAPILDGNKILAGTVGANALIAGEAIITGSAQIANAIIDSVHLKTAIIDQVHIKDGVINTAKIADYLASTTWSDATKQGWKLSKTGKIEGNEIVIYDDSGATVFSKGGFQGYTAGDLISSVQISTTQGSPNSVLFDGTDNGTWKTLGGLTLTATGSDIIIVECLAEIFISQLLTNNDATYGDFGPGNATIKWRIRRSDGVIVYESGASALSVPGQAPTFMIGREDTAPPAGTVTYYIDVRWDRTTYNAGTITYSIASGAYTGAVTGTGTTWRPYVSRYWEMQLPSDSLWYPVSSVASDTAINLSPRSGALTFPSAVSGSGSYTLRNLNQSVKGNLINYFIRAYEYRN